MIGFLCPIGIQTLLTLCVADSVEMCREVDQRMLDAVEVRRGAHLVRARAAMTATNREREPLLHLLIHGWISHHRTPTCAQLAIDHALKDWFLLGSEGLGGTTVPPSRYCSPTFPDHSPTFLERSDELSTVCESGYPQGVDEVNGGTGVPALPGATAAVR